MWDFAISKLIQLHLDTVVAMRTSIRSLNVVQQTVISSIFSKFELELDLERDVE